MALAHVTATRLLLADVVGDQLDSGDLQFLLADATTEVATIALTATAFDAAATATITLNGTPLSDSSATGNAADVAVFKFRTGAAAEVFRGVLHTSTGDINLSSLAIAAGDTVQLTSFTYTSSA